MTSRHDWAGDLVSTADLADELRRLLAEDRSTPGARTALAALGAVVG